MIVDAHCHAGRGDRLNAPWSANAPLDAYLRRARAAGIDKTIVIPAGHSNYAQANAELAGIVARRPDRLIGFASVHSQRDAGRIYEIVAGLTSGSFVGHLRHRYRLSSATTQA